MQMVDVHGATAVDAYDVVIMGAGYAGLMAAFRLAGKSPTLRIALVSESEHFFERVRLQECITNPPEGRLSPLAALVAGTNVTFIGGRIEALDPGAGIVRVKCGADKRMLGFAHAIYALGSRIEQDSVSGVAEHAYRLDRGDDARGVTGLRAALRERARDGFRVVIVGGANTATEVAGETERGAFLTCGSAAGVVALGWGLVLSTPATDDLVAAIRLSSVRQRYAAPC
jgi:NADH:quinone reductase (non-electrogenic)